MNMSNNLVEQNSFLKQYPLLCMRSMIWAFAKNKQKFESSSTIAKSDEKNLESGHNNNEKDDNKAIWILNSN